MELTVLTNFLEGQESGLALLVFRLGVCLGVLVNFLSCYGKIDDFWGPQGIVQSNRWKKQYFKHPFNLLDFLFNYPRGHRIIFWALITSSFLVGIGFGAPYTAVIMWFSFFALFCRNRFLTGGQDLLLLWFVFLLVFSEYDKVGSVSYFLIANEWNLGLTVEKWPLQIARLVTVFVIVGTAFHKLKCMNWRNLTALEIVDRNYFTLRNFPINSRPLIQGFYGKILSASVLVGQVILPITVWIPETQKISAVLLILLHLGIQLTLNIGLFQYAMVVGLTLFLL